MSWCISFVGRFDFIQQDTPFLSIPYTRSKHSSVRSGLWCDRWRGSQAEFERAYYWAVQIQLRIRLL